MFGMIKPTTTLKPDKVVQTKALVPCLVMLSPYSSIGSRRKNSGPLQWSRTNLRAAPTAITWIDLRSKSQ